MSKGFTDKAAEVDDFGIEGYITGLSKFISTCNTPMTVGIQGDWGTGKTSIMMMIKKKLEGLGNSKIIWFNTWQFSQFNMGNDLALSLISCLLDEMELDAKNSENMRNIFGTVAKFAKTATVMLVDSQLGGKVADAVEGALSKDTKTDLPTAIKNLRISFEACVNNTLARNKGPDRLVVFIDDLDRLQPSKAVELLEVLKLFLDCEKCVFVLAIDYNVVQRGVADKYGGKSGSLIGEEKGRSFFDKIIQVPFKMPIASYNIINYVRTCFNEIGIVTDAQPEMDFEPYVSLIQNTIGYNPRSMKRMFNAFLLLTYMTSDQLLEPPKNKQMLFAILCLQQSNETMYNYIVRNRTDIDAKWIEDVKKRDNCCCQVALAAS